MNKIDPKKEYSLYEVMGFGVIGKTYSTVTRKVLEDMTGKNVLKAKVTEIDGARRYKIKGRNLIKYLEKMERG